MAQAILIIANPYDGQLLARAIASGGYTPVVDDGGGDIAELLRRESPGAVVLSSRLSRIPSADVLAAVREVDQERQVPVMLIGSPSGEVATLDDAVRLGADQLLLRPVEPLLLKSKIDALVGERSTRVRAGEPKPAQGLRVGSAPEGAARPDAEQRIATMLELARESDYFAVLGVTPEATSDQVRTAFGCLAAAFEPSSLDPKLAQRYASELAEVEAVLEEAYRVLIDDRLRTAYRANL